MKQSLMILECAILGHSKQNYENVRDAMIERYGYDKFRMLQRIAFRHILNLGA